MKKMLLLLLLFMASPVNAQVERFVGQEVMVSDFCLTDESILDILTSMSLGPDMLEAAVTVHMASGECISVEKPGGKMVIEALISEQVPLNGFILAAVKGYFVTNDGRRSPPVYAILGEQEQSV